MGVGLVTGGLVIIGMLGVMVRWARRRRLAAALEGRESLDDQAFYGRYYAESKLPKDLVIELRREVVETLRVSAEKLQPGDRFGEQIGTYWTTSDDLDVLAAKGRNRAKALGLSVDLKKLATVDEYIRCFAKSSAV
jgi:hypothetical protein